MTSDLLRGGFLKKSLRLSSEAKLIAKSSKLLSRWGVALLVSSSIIDDKSWTWYLLKSIRGNYISFNTLNPWRIMYFFATWTIYIALLSLQSRRLGTERLITYLWASRRMRRYFLKNMIVNDVVAFDIFEYDLISLKPTFKCAFNSLLNLICCWCLSLRLSMNIFLDWRY